MPLFPRSPGRVTEFTIIASLILLPATFSVAQSAAREADGLARAAIPASVVGGHVGQGPPSEWVETTSTLPLPTFPDADLSNGLHYLLSDTQANVATEEFFYRSAWRIASDAGLRSISEISLDFDPSYQKLTIHWIRVIRDGQARECYDPAKVRVLDRESELERKLLDGSRTALVVLEDLQVGDTIDYAYTSKGLNPAFGGKFMSRISLGWEEPMERTKVRVLWPKNRRIQFKLLGDSPAPELTAPSSDIQLLTHTNGPVRAYHREAKTPGWVLTYPELQLSEFESWEQTAAWALSLYGDDTPLPDAIRNEIGTIREASPEPEERAARALQYIQSKIRYLGLEMGEGSFRPRTPEEICRTRFGDCKDKSLLLSRMLQALDLDAAPALVNTRRQRGIREFLPGPNAFNHAVVRLALGDSTYYLDPTNNLQQGALNLIAPADNDVALPVRKESVDLEDIKFPEGYSNSGVVHETYVFPAPDQPAKLSVHTRYEGARAEGTRSYLFSTSINEVTRAYTKYYASHYPEARSASAVRFKDFPAENAIEVWEEYEIPRFWQAADGEEGVWTSTVMPQVMIDELIIPDAAERKAPLWLAHPAKCTQKIDVRFWEDWETNISTRDIEIPAVKFKSTSSTNGPLLQIICEYQSRSDHVTPADFPEYLSSISRIYDSLGWKFTKRPPGTDPPTATSQVAPPAPFALHLPSAAATGLTLLAFVTLGHFAATRPRFRLPLPLSPDGIRGPEGLGGWLILPQVQLWVTIVLILFLFSTELRWPFNASQWPVVLDNVVAEDHALFKATVFGELVANTLLLLGGIVLLIGLYRKKHWMPKAMIAYYAFGFLFLLAEHGLMSELNLIDAGGAEDETTSPREVVQSFLRLLIWGLYFTRSKRVKATFRH